MYMYKYVIFFLNLYYLQIKGQFFKKHSCNIVTRFTESCLIYLGQVQQVFKMFLTSDECYTEVYMYD